MADIHKRLEKAEKYLQKGKQADALDEYLIALDEDPNNHNVRQTAADLCINLGHNKEAAELLSALFDHQAGIGDQAKAVMNYKKLVKSGAPTIDQTYKYSQLIEKTDKKTALEGYELAIKAFEAADRRAESLAALKRVVLLDPTAANHKRLGELAELLNDPKAASLSFFKLGELEADQALSWLERGYKLDSANADLTLAYAKALNGVKKSEQVIEVLAPLATAAGSTAPVREQYAHALMALKRAAEAEPFVWELYEKDPAQVDEMKSFLNLLISQDQSDKALALAHKLENSMGKQGKRKEFINLMQEVTSQSRPSVEFLEYMVELYNSANREHDYCTALLSLFQLYFAANNYLKAADSLDRAVEVDPYGSEHKSRLEMLKGKIDQNRFTAIADRLRAVGVELGDGAPSGTAAAPKMEEEPTVLEDFMLQAEIFLQYGMRSKAVERLERVNKLFPREEEKNEKLHKLYSNAGMNPKYDAAPAAVAPAPAPVSGVGQPTNYGSGTFFPAASTQGHDESAVDNFSRVTEITRNIYRQSTVKGVLFAAVNDVGRHYHASRCVAGLCSPGKPPSAALEYCSPGIKQSDVQHLVKLLAAVQAVAVQVGIVSLPNAQGSAELAGVRESLAALGIRSLLAVPLVDSSNDEHVGLLLLEQCDQPRNFNQTDAVVLKTIADQMVLAVNNAKLRSLMKNLAVTDEKSGLLKRSSYLDVLLSEAKRSITQNSTASVLLFHFGKASALVKEIGEAGVENMMQQIGQNICAQVRQNDVAVRYELTTIALILPDTSDKNCFFVVEKMRKALAALKVPNSDKPLPITVGIAEAVMQSQYDPIDIVTEVINRAESALEAARAEGGNTAKSLAPQFLNSAVA
ncbi:MAG TPA: diguanylate cyclase [Terriglobales bacterium]|nr:diguanylate cyclase [Terriglobales bacterium]